MATSKGGKGPINKEDKTSDASDVLVSHQYQFQSVAVLI